MARWVENRFKEQSEITPKSMTKSIENVVKIHLKSMEDGAQIDKKSVLIEKIGPQIEIEKNRLWDRFGRRIAARAAPRRFPREKNRLLC